VKELGEVMAAFEVDIAWKPAETFTFRFTNALDYLSAAAVRAGIPQPRHLTTQRPERELTTIVVEGVLVL
jgi:hypothetical protein